MTKIESINPEPEDFTAAEATVGPLLEENGSPAEALILYQAARAHKLIRRLKETAQRIREPGSAVGQRSKKTKRGRRQAD